MSWSLLGPRELERLTDSLSGGIRQLAESYTTSLSQLSDEVATLVPRTEGHLARMGFKP